LGVDEQLFVLEACILHLLVARDVGVGVGATACLHDVKALGWAKDLTMSTALAVFVLDRRERGFGDVLFHVWLGSSSDRTTTAVLADLLWRWWFGRLRFFGVDG
jgi:hypothetical protein